MSFTAFIPLLFLDSMHCETEIWVASEKFAQHLSFLHPNLAYKRFSDDLSQDLEKYYQFAYPQVAKLIPVEFLVATLPQGIRLSTTGHLVVAQLVLNRAYVEARCPDPHAPPTRGRGRGRGHATIMPSIPPTPPTRGHGHFFSTQKYVASISSTSSIWSISSLAPTPRMDAMKSLILKKIIAMKSSNCLAREPLAPVTRYIKSQTKTNTLP